MRISIDGSLGSNLTYYLKKLESDGYKVNFKDNLCSSNLAVKYQSDVSRYSFSYYLQILNNYIDASRAPDPNLNIFERSPYSFMNIFSKIAVESGQMDVDEHQLYQKYYENFGWKPDYIIYLYYDPNIYHSQNQDNQTHNLDYLKKLHLCHEMSFDEHNCPVPIYKINAHDTPETIYKNIKDILGGGNSPMTPFFN